MCKLEQLQNFFGGEGWKFCVFRKDNVKYDTTDVRDGVNWV